MKQSSSTMPSNSSSTTKPPWIIQSPSTQRTVSLERPTLPSTLLPGPTVPALTVPSLPTSSTDVKAAQPKSADAEISVPKSTDVETGLPWPTRELVAAIEAQRESGAWSPTTSKRAAEFSALLTTMAETADDHVELLASHAWDIIDRLTQKNSKVETELSDATSELRAANSLHERIEFALNLGDWISKLLSKDRNAIRTKHKSELISKLMNQGESLENAEASAAQQCRFKDLGNHVNHEMLERWCIEGEKFQKWSAEGKKGDAPPTPWINFAQTASDFRALDVVDFITLSKLYAQRNIFAHRSAPSPRPHVIEGTQGKPTHERINWEALRETCQGMESDILKFWASERLEANDKDSLIEMVKWHWRQYSSTDHNSKDVLDRAHDLTTYAMEEATRACDQHDAQESAAASAS